MAFKYIVDAGVKNVLKREAARQIPSPTVFWAGEPAKESERIFLLCEEKTCITEHPIS